RHHVAERAQPGVPYLACPPGVENPGVRPHLVALGVEVMLDGADPPHAHLVRGLDDVHPFMEHAMVERRVAADRTLALAILTAVGRDHRVELKYYFGLRHHSLSLILMCYALARAAYAASCDLARPVNR